MRININKPKLKPTHNKNRFKKSQTLFKKSKATPHEIIEKTPDIITKEAFFLKSGKNMVHISDMRMERRVAPNISKYRAFVNRYKSKHIFRIHTHNSSARQMPSAGDIAVFFMDFYNEFSIKNKSANNIKIKKDHLRKSKTEVISIINPEGKETGRVHVRLTPESVESLRQLYDGFNNSTRTKIANDIKNKIDFLTMQKILEYSKQKIKLTDDQKYRLHLNATHFYFENVLKLHMKYKAMPGYKYNKMMREFEKIEQK